MQTKACLSVTANNAEVQAIFRCCHSRPMCRCEDALHHVCLDAPLHIDTKGFKHAEQMLGPLQQFPELATIVLSAMILPKFSRAILLVVPTASSHAISSWESSGWSTSASILVCVLVCLLAFLGGGLRPRCSTFFTFLIKRSVCTEEREGILKIIQGNVDMS